MSRLALTDLKKDFGSTPVIRGVSLTAESGEFVVFVGPSGCGKSTLLRMIAGLESCTSGSIAIDGREITGIDPSKRGIAMVFQTYALYPHMTVAENMGFGLEMAGMGRPEREAKVLAAARTLNLEDYLERKPKALSGGQRQRVAIGRAIVRDPKVFLFDEPLSNLDAELRVKMRLEIAKLHRDLGSTMVYVTHDQVEAMTLADRIVVIRDGLVEQEGRPLDLYDDPENIFVAGFIGSPRMNFLPAAVTGRDEDGLVRLRIDKLGLQDFAVRPRQMPETVPDRMVLGVRPEDLTEGEAGGHDVTIRCNAIERLGGVSYAYTDPGEDETIIAQLHRHTAIGIGDRISVGIDPASCYLFGPDGRRI